MLTIFMKKQNLVWIIKRVQLFVILCSLSLDSKAKLAEFTECMDFVKWTSPVGEVLDIRACDRRLVSLSKEKTKAKNQLHIRQA